MTARASSSCHRRIGASRCVTGLARSVPIDDAVRTAGLFDALGDADRIRLLTMIGSAPRRWTCSCELHLPGRSRAVVRIHLGVLIGAGVLMCERRGRWVWYAGDPRCLDGARRALGDAASPPFD